jgi:RNA polymerase sigma-70 factor (ECF subfamily)
VDESAVPDRSEVPPEGRLDKSELKRAVAAAIESLPHRQRVALTLFEYEGLSYEQVAAVLDVSTDSVRSLLLRARATLRGKLAGLV